MALILLSIEPSPDRGAITQKDGELRKVGCYVVTSTEADLDSGVSAVRTTRNEIPFDELLGINGYTRRARLCENKEHNDFGERILLCRHHGRDRRG